MTPKVDHTEDLRAATTALRAAREAEASARARLREAVLAALADGVSELSIARETGLSRTSVRAWRGESAGAPGGEAETAT